MNPEIPTEAQNIVRAYMAVLEDQYRANESFPMPASTLPYSKPIIKQSVHTIVTTLSSAGQLNDELRGVLEIAYTSLADYLDDELVRVMREYQAALSDLDHDGRMGRDKTDTAAWARVSETSALVARIAHAIAQDTDALRTEFQTFGSPAASPIPSST